MYWTWLPLLGAVPMSAWVPDYMSAKRNPYRESLDQDGHAGLGALDRRADLPARRRTRARNDVVDDVATKGVARGVARPQIEIGGRGPPRARVVDVDPAAVDPSVPRDVDLDEPRDRVRVLPGGRERL